MSRRTAGQTTQPFTPAPHSRAELDRARDGLVVCVRALVAQGCPLPPVLMDAWAPLGRMLDENAEHDERQRREALSRELHYVAKPGAKVTLCGLDVRGVGTGWTGIDNEYLHRAVERGQNICAACLTVADGGEQPS